MSNPTVRVGVRKPGEWAMEMPFAVTDYAITIKPEGIHELIMLTRDLYPVPAFDIAHIVNTAAEIGAGRADVTKFGTSIDALPDGVTVAVNDVIIVGEGA
jgi:hypothetical protein